MTASTQKHAGGRPRKFTEKSHPVTMTLPERVLAQLSAVDPDRARAIVKVTEAVIGSDPSKCKPVQLVEVLPGQSVIVVGPCKALQRIPWIRLAEITPARNLLVIPSGTAVESLEVAVVDLLETLDPSERYEYGLLTELKTHLALLRRQRKISKAEIILFQTAKTKKSA